ncbi:hypothetical protein CQA53_03670 [Helicobacter didelphidarum]|uniref:Uncharacterized protein n=1 Tax=Helicobacter didelphidarum TaxID=2040648 RepID=A0A3D8INN1_9HELI|nr:hypothetical protein [Helicobacter didelphidarum]RDU66545.1 hypothetical protein CQA53_03670 [Helicobacter didelphidarum]
MAIKLLCLSSAETSLFAKSFLQYLSKASQVEYDYAEIEPFVLSKIPFAKMKEHFCSQTPDFIMSFDGHYRYLQKEPDVPFIEMSNSVAGPIKHNRAFIKNPVEWENKVVKVEPEWYNKIIPIEDKTIYQITDSYRYVYLRSLVAEYLKNPVKKELPFAFYIPDWNTHTDDILQNIYRYLDFCRQDQCGLHVVLSKAVLDSGDLSLEEKYKAKRKSIDATLKTIKDEIKKFNKEYEEEGLKGIITDNTNYEKDLLKYNIRLLSIEPSSTTWLESLYLLKAKGVACNKIRLVFANGQRFPGTDDFDKALPEVEKYFKEELMRRDKHSTLGQIFTTTDRFFHFLGFQENFALHIDFDKIAKILANSENTQVQ